MKRKRKGSDQEETTKAYELLLNLVKNNPEIEVSLWAGALMSAFVDMHERTGFTYRDFCQVLDDVKSHYKNWLGKDKD